MSVVINSMNDSSVQRVLALNGIDVAEFQARSSYRSANRSVQCYTLLVYDLAVLEISVRRPGMQTKGERMPFNKSSQMMKQLCKTAIRATYCLGLTLAKVTLCVQKEQLGYQVIAVDMHPVLNKRQRAILAQAKNQAAQVEQSLLQSQAMIGMDVEFILCNTDGKVVSAAQFVQRRGRVGYDGIRILDRIIYPIVELRPKPSISPSDVFEQLQQAMVEAAVKIDDQHLSWIAGGMPKKGFRLGGHIHLSKICLTSRLLRALDNYLALPFAMLEGEGSWQRRPRYGYLGDYRHQFHGGFEYRTLPSWISTPLIAKGVIALVRLIADHYRELQQTPLSIAEVQAYYYAGDKVALLPYVHQLWQDLVRTDSYKIYKDDLEPFKQHIFSLYTIEDNTDLRRHWHIAPFTDYAKQ